MYIKSSDIKVFPSSFRDNSVNPASCLMTEENIKSLKTLSDDNKLKSYFTSQLKDGVYYFNITLMGYTFVFNITSEDLLGVLPTGITSDNIYAMIRLTENDNGFTTLVKQDGGIAILDIEENDQKEFQGLLLTTQVTENAGYYYIKLGNIADGVITIDNDKTCKLNKSEILDEYDSTNNIEIGIDEQFHTDLLGTNSERIPQEYINNSDINTSKVNNTITLTSTEAQGGNILRAIPNSTIPQSVIVPQYSSNNNNYVLSVNSNGQLVWREPYDGSYTASGNNN